MFDEKITHHFSREGVIAFCRHVIVATGEQVCLSCQKQDSANEFREF